MLQRLHMHVILVVCGAVLSASNLEKVGVMTTKEMVEAAQKAWGDGIVKIAAAHTSGGDY